MLNLASSSAVDAARSIECRRWLALGGVLAGTCLGVALQLSNGMLVPGALALVAIAFALTAAAGVMPRPAHLARMDARIVPLLGLAALAIHLGCLYTSLPAIYLRLDAAGLTPFQSGVAVLAIVCACTAWSPGRWAKPLQIVALVAAHAALGAGSSIDRRTRPSTCTCFSATPSPRFAQASIPTPSPFRTSTKGSAYYGPDLSVGGRLQFGFPYFP